MSTIYAPSAAGTAMQSQASGYGDAGQSPASESSVLRAMNEAQQIMGEFALKENTNDMKASLDRREASLQKKRLAVYKSAENEKDAAWDRAAAGIAAGFVAIVGGAISLTSVVGGGQQMSKAATEGSLTGLSSFTERGFKLDAWNKVGHSAQGLQGVGGVISSIGQKTGADKDVEKKFQDLDGQMQDSDASISMDISRRRNGDAAEATKRVEKVNELQLEFLRSAMRTLA